MEFKNNNDNRLLQDIGLKLSKLLQDSIVEHQGESWKIVKPLDSLFFRDDIKDLNKAPGNSISLCKVSNGVEVKYAIVSVFYSQEDKYNIYPIALESIFNNAVERLKESSNKLIDKADLLAIAKEEMRRTVDNGLDKLKKD